MVSGRGGNAITPAFARHVLLTASQVKIKPGLVPDNHVSFFRRLIMENTVVGVYDSYSQAQRAMNELLASGFSQSNVQMNPEQESSATAAGSAPAGHDSGHGIGHFFRSLFGMDDKTEHHDIYSEAVRRGSCVLMVDADSDDERVRAMEVMNRFDPVDIEERSTHWKSQGWTGYDANAPRMTEDEIQQERSRYAQGSDATMYAQGQENTLGTAGASAVDQTRTAEASKIPVVEEELKVGKREVQRGGVRVFQRVKETPVHESVTLREEHVKVERRPVDQPATEADMAAFKEGSVEMREMAEEPVVEKTARIVEEVVVAKEVVQQQADINDTVRRTDVEVEQLGAGAATTGGAMADDSDFRSHWQSAYGQSGGRYEDYDAAYRYGSSMGGTERFKNYRWDDAEPQMRSDWESHHPESTWDKVKDAVRYGVERVKGSTRH
jgi:uncharacterized protein (TIGR02271 family)